MIKNIKTALCLFVVSFAVSGCRGKEWRTEEGAVWGTSFHITYLADADLSDSIRSAMRAVELSLSPFDKESLVSKINGGGNVVCDSDFITVYNGAREVWKASDGAFDPTVAPAVNLWGFGYKNGSGEPSDEEVDSVRTLIGFGSTYLEDNGSLMREAGMEFDFSAITKGYGCDRVGAMLRRNGCTDYMVEIGGEIALSGSNKRGEKWHIMIDAPIEDNEKVVHNRMAVIALTDCGIATSGNYRNYKEVAGGKIWHTIDPRTCRPAVTNTLSATVIAGNAMMADALATACMVMSADSAVKMVESFKGASVMLIIGKGENKSEWEIIESKGFPKTEKAD